MHNLKEIKENAIQAHNAPMDFMDELNGVAPKGSGNGERIVQDLLKNMLRSITESVELTGYINPMNKVYAIHK